MEFRGSKSGSERLSTSLRIVRRYQLLAACLVITLCFLIANDVYGARTLLKKHRDLFPGDKKVIDYSSARWAMVKNELSRSDLSKRYLIDPRRKEQKSLLRAFAGGDECNTAGETIITTLPYNDAAGNLVGKADNYDLPTSAVGSPLTGCPTCVGLGGQDSGGISGPRGAVFPGTGFGSDAAYKISFSQPNANITVTMDPTNTADDLAVMVYTSACSSNRSDAIVIDDTNGGGALESVTITAMPAGTYHVVVDVYSYYYYIPQADPGGPYTLNVTCVTGQTCIQPSVTAASVTVSGRVLSSENGRGLTNATVQIADQSGHIRTATTGRNGFYQFDEVEAGQTYIISVSSKRFGFTPRALTTPRILTLRLMGKPFRREPTLRRATWPAFFTTNFFAPKPKISSY
jgi:hypothetical protein